MKQILVLALVVMFLPIVLFALWYVFKTPGMLDAEDDYPILHKDTKGARS